MYQHTILKAVKGGLIRIVNCYYTQDIYTDSITLHVIRQLEDGTKKIEAITNSKFMPYFYSKRNIEHHRIVGKEVVNAINGTFNKYTVKLPQDVPALRSMDAEGNVTDFEADVLFSKRYIYDTNTDIGRDKLKKAYIDIEVDISKEHFADPELDEIKSIAIVSGNYKVFIIVNNSKPDGEAILNERNGIETVYTHTEKQLLLEFFDAIKDYSMLIGWNLRQFDYEFIRIRSMKYQMSLKLNEFVWMDMMSLYKRFVTSYSKTTIATSFSLDNVSKLELGEGKKVTAIEALKGSIEQLAEYNINDCVLVEKLDRKTKLTDLIDSIALTLNLLVDDCTWFSNAIEMSIMRKMCGKYIFKCRRKLTVTSVNVEGTLQSQHESAFEGAYVHEPPTGILNNIATFDFASLYPNIIRTFNLSPETIVEDIDLPKNPDVILSPMGYHFKKNEIGIYNEFITNLLNLRKQYKKLYVETNDETYNTLQIGTKFLISAFYGILGHQTSRIYDVRIAESVTAVGRFLIKSFEKDYEVVYGDTDSIMIPIEVAPSRDAKTIIKEMEKTMNTHISNELKQFNIGTNYLNIRFEKLCDKIYFYGKKKRYYGHIVLNEEFKQCDEIIARGLEIRRTDWCKLATEYEHKILGMLLNDIKGAIAYHKEYVSNISKLELPKFVIFKSLTKPIGQYKSPPPHVRAAVEGDYIGTKIGYVVTGYHKHKITEVKRYDPDKKQNINPSISYYTERQLIPIYERLLKPLTGKQGTLNGERFGQVTKTKRKRRNEVLGKQQRRFE